MCFVVPVELGRLEGLVALERNGVLSGWIFRDDGLASKSGCRETTLKGRLHGVGQLCRRTGGVEFEIVVLQVCVTEIALRTQLA